MFTKTCSHAMSGVRDKAVSTADQKKKETMEQNPATAFGMI